MASVTISHVWSDGSVTKVRVVVDDSYPQTLAEAKATAVAALAETVEKLGE